MVTLTGTAELFKIKINSMKTNKAMKLSVTANGTIKSSNLNTLVAEDRKSSMDLRQELL